MPLKPEISFNVIHVLDEKYPPDPRVDLEIAILRKLGFHVDLVVLQNNLETNPTWNNIKISNLTYKLSALAYSVPLYHIIILLRLIVSLRKVDFNVLHCHDLRVARAVFWYSRIRKKPFILDLHENRPEIMYYYGFMQRPISRILIRLSLWKRWEKLLIKASVKTIVVTNEAKEDYSKGYNIPLEKFVVLPNSVASSFRELPMKFEKNDLEEINRIIYVGDTSSRRGLATVVKAISELKKRGILFFLTILGSSKDDDSLNQLIDQLGIADQITHLGWVSQDSILLELQKAHIGICPIHRNKHHDTTYANKLFQYMSAGLVLLCSDCPAQKHLVEAYNLGYIFKDRDETDLVRVLELIKSNPKTALSMGKNSWNTLRNDLTVDKISSEFQSFYSTLSATTA